VECEASDLGGFLGGVDYVEREVLVEHKQRPLGRVDEAWSVAGMEDRYRMVVGEPRLGVGEVERAVSTVTRVRSST
jgi:hypothetical protein